MFTRVALAVDWNFDGLFSLVVLKSRQNFVLLNVDLHMDSSRRSSKYLVCQIPVKDGRHQLDIRSL